MVKSVISAPLVAPKVATIHLFDWPDRTRFENIASAKRRDVDKLKLISDDKNYDKIYAASSLTRRDGTRMLFEDYRTFKIHPIG